MNPDYERLGELAKQIVIRTMQEGEQTHPGNEWQTASIQHHTVRMEAHAIKACNHRVKFEPENEDDIAHCLTRCAMIKYLQK